mgnify:CR=1 FL=1
MCCKHKPPNLMLNKKIMSEHLFNLVHTVCPVIKHNGRKRTE